MTLPLNLYLNAGGRLLLGTPALPSSQADRFRLYFSLSSSGPFSSVKDFPNSPDKGLYSGNALVDVRRSDLGVTDSDSFYLKVTSFKGAVESTIGDSDLTSVPPVGSANNDLTSEDQTLGAQLYGYHPTSKTWQRVLTDGEGVLEVSDSNTDDVATETTLSSADGHLAVIEGDTTSIDGKLDALATEATLAAAAASLSAIDTQTDDVATETTLSSADGHLAVIEGATTSLDTKAPALGSNVMANSRPVTMASDQPAILFVQDQRGPGTSAFSRIRTAEPELLYDLSFLYSKLPRKTSEFTASGGTVTHSPNDSTVDLAVTTSDGSRALIQSRRYVRYEPGRSLLLCHTFVMGTGVANIKKRAGFFDDNDGVFFQLNGTSPEIVLRSRSSGSVVETVIPQASWNLDTFGGNGPSGYTLDFSKAHILITDLQWLGVGRVRVGFDVDGQIIYAHEFLHANVVTTTYMQKATLPLRWEIVNDGGSSSSSVLKAICVAAISEGGQINVGYPSAVSNGVTGRTFIAGGTPVLSARLNPTHVRATADPLSFQVVVDGAADVYVEVLVNTTLTGAAWVANTGNSILQKDISATAVSGGELIASFHLITDGKGAVSAIPLIDRFTLGSSYSGTSDTVSVVLYKISGAGNINAYVNMQFQEIT